MSTTSSKAEQFRGGGYALLSSEVILLASMLPVLVVHSVPWRAKNSWQASSDLIPKEAPTSSISPCLRRPKCVRSTSSLSGTRLVLGIVAVAGGHAFGHLWTR